MVHSPVSIQMGRWLSQLFADKCTDVLSRCFWEGVMLSTSNRAVAGEEMISVSSHLVRLSQRGALRNENGTKEQRVIYQGFRCHVVRED